jgi:hypothetical protein
VMQKFNQFEMSLIARAVATIRQESDAERRARQVLADYGLGEKTAPRDRRMDRVSDRLAR